MTIYTQLARLPQIVPFDPAVRNAWGPPINAAWNAIEQLAAGNGPIDLTGQTSYSVTVANDASDQARQAMLPFIGATPSACTVTIPPISRIGWVSNGTNNNLILSAGGVSLTVPVGMSVLYTVTGNAVTAVPIGFAVDGQVNGALTVSGALTVRSAASMRAGMDVIGNVTFSSHLFAAADANTGLNTIYTTPNIVGRGGTVTNGLNIRTSTGSLLFSMADTAGAAGVFVGSVNASTFVTTSDGRAKSQIADISADDAYAWVRAGRARTYTIGGRRRAGFIAQEDLASGRGDAVYKMADSRDLYALSDGYAPAGHRLARDYDYDVAYLTKALAGALARIEALEAAAGAV